MSPLLATDRVTWEEQRQQVEGHGYPSPFGTFGDTSVTPGENLWLLMGHRPLYLGWAQGAMGPWVRHVELWVKAQGPGWGYVCLSAWALVLLQHLPCHKKPCRMWGFFYVFI